MKVNNINKETFIEIVKNSRNALIACKQLSISRGTFIKYCTIHDINITHFKMGKESKIPPTKCKYCNNNIIATGYTRQFCNSSCAASYNNSRRKHRPWSIEQRRAVSNQNKLLPDKNVFLDMINECATQQEVCIELGITFLTFQKYCTYFSINISDYFPKTNIIRIHKTHIIKNPRRCQPNTIEKKCIICNKIFRDYKWGKKKTCCVECGRRSASIKQSIYLKTHRSHIRGPHQQSYMEMSFEQWLNVNGYKKGIHGYLTEVYFYNPVTKKNGFADFVFPKLHIIIELDGTHHLKRMDLDKIRDDHLKTRGWNVIRISQREYVKKSMIPLISNLLGIKMVGMVGVEPTSSIIR